MPLRIYLTSRVLVEESGTVLLDEQQFAKLRLIVETAQEVWG